MPKLVQTVHARIDGKIVLDTGAYIGFLTDHHAIVIPKCHLFGLRYSRRRGSDESCLGRLVRTVEIPVWLAREKNLETDD